MKVVILCGGQGSRIKGVSDIVPKPMVNVGHQPILWHIMKLYAHYGYHEFILCLGYKGWMIKEFFLNYYAKTSDLTISLNKENWVVYHDKSHEHDWKVTLAETGEESQTGTRVRLIKKFLSDTEPFHLTYGDGLADIDIGRLVKAHQKFGGLGTLTGVHPAGRFGEIEVAGHKIKSFNEKPNVTSGMINGGFMIFEPRVFGKYFTGEEDVILEKDIIPLIVRDKKMGIYEHEGFWQCMDTPREHALLNKLWQDGEAPWKLWK